MHNAISSASQTSIPDVQPPPVLDLDPVIHDYVHYVLALNNGNKKKTARRLGISRSTLYRILGNLQNTIS